MWRRTSRDRVVIAVLLIATVTVLTLDFRTGVLDGIGGATSQVVGVFQGGVRAVAAPIESAIGFVGEIGSLRSENQRLRREISKLRGEMQNYQDLAREAARMRQLLQIESTLSLDPIRARVIGAALSGFERTAFIDKGGSDGLVVESAVLAPEGLAGRVSSVGAQTATVQLVTDPQSSIGVRIGESGETGLATGTGGRDLRLELVDQKALEREGVKRGDLVVTSGHQGGIFPPGIPIGKIDDVHLASRGASYRILIRPFAQLSKLDVVTVSARSEARVQPQPTPSPGGEEG